MMDGMVKIPQIKGKITIKTVRGKKYVYFEYGRIYHPEKRYNVPQRAVIGRVDDSDTTMMHPNNQYLKYIPDGEIPQESDAKHSHCLRIGSTVVIKKILQYFRIPEMLAKYFAPKETGLFLDMVAYSLICENNAGQYYPDYAYNHPLFTPNMHVYSDSKVSDFLTSITADQSVAFLNDWNAVHDHREKIYISYDSTNKNSQAGDLEIVEYGHPKVDVGLPVFNYSMAYDTYNRVPLFYEEYPGSIVDVSQLRYMLDKAKEYGYRHAGFILDRGYFSKDNIKYLENSGYDFVIMMKGRKSLARELIRKHQGEFENKRSCGIRDYKAYGITIKGHLFDNDTKECYFHLYYSDLKKSAEREAIEAKVERMAKLIQKHEGKKFEPSKAYKEYFNFTFDRDGALICATEKESVIEEEISLCGYYVIVTSEQMNAKDALTLYKSRDNSEKLFRGDKSYLGNSSLRVCSDESASAKIFVEFVALIVRCRIYTLLKREAQRMDKKENYMTVPAAMRELEKIEMIKLTSGRYRLSHALTATQKAILQAFNLTEENIRWEASKISDAMAKVED